MPYRFEYSGSIFDEFIPNYSNSSPDSSGFEASKIKRDKFELDKDGFIKSGFYKGCKPIDEKISSGDFVAFVGYKSCGVCFQNRRGSILFMDLELDDIITRHCSEAVKIIPSKDILNNFIENLNKIIENRDGYLYNSYMEYIEDFLKTNKYLKDNILPRLSLPVCSVCGEKHLRTFVYDNKNYCRDCFNELFTYCSRCNQMFPRDVGDECTDGGILCPRCAKRDFVLPYHHYYPQVKFFGNNKNNTVPFMGVEIEVDEGGQSDSSVREVVKIMNKDNNIFMYCSRDGSLENGFEMITQPATIEYHYSIKDLYKSTFDRLLELEYLSHDTSTCGLHVHFNRSFYADNESVYINNLLYLVDKFWDDIVKFSRRNNRRLDRYAKKVPYSEAKDYIRCSNKLRNHSDHYYSINISNLNTIEFRMFKGTLNIDTFFATLQFVYNCILCAKQKTLEEIELMKFEDLITGRVCKKYWNRRKGITNTEE